MGKTPSRNNSDYWNTKDNKWISIADLSKCEKYITDTKEYISDIAIKESGINPIPANTVVMSFKLSIGKTAITKEVIYSNEAIMSFRDKKTIELLPDYTYYLMMSKRWDEGTNKAVMGKTLNKATLSEIKVSVHDIAEQQRIVNVLDKLTTLIDKRKKQLKKLDELVKSRFVEMFGDPVENPYSWEQTTLKNISIGKLSYGSGASACEYDGKTRYIRITDIDSCGRLNEDVVSPSIIEEKYILNDGDILFARSGATVGKSYRYRKSDGKCLYAGYLIRLIPNAELVLPDYVFYYTKTSYYERFIASNIKVVAQPNINAQQYGDLTICIPPMELQKEFIAFVEQVDKSKFEIKQSLEKLELLKKALMQKYFG